MPLATLAHAFSTDLVAALDASRRAGFQGVVLDPVVYPQLRELSQTGAREVVHRLSQAGQQLVGIDLRLGSLAPSQREADVEREIDRVQRGLDLARRLQSRLVLCDVGPLPPAPSEPVAKPVIAPQMLGKLILPEMPVEAPRATLPRDLPFEANVDAFLRDVGTRADRAGCLVAFRASLGSFAALQGALTRVDCPYFGVDLDPLAMLADEWSLDAIFSAVGPLVRHVRGRDGLKGTGNRVTPIEIGMGHVDWPALSSALRDTDYAGPLTIDAIDLPDRAGSTIRGAGILGHR